MLKLVSIDESPLKLKKWRAIFNDNTHTDFGQRGFSDFTINKSEQKKANYIKRHKARENWNDPKTAGALSRFVLWNKPTLKASIADYKKRFNL